MSAAKRKTARRGRAAAKPARRGPTRRKAAKGERCTLPVARLAQVFDRADVRDEVLAHVPGCVPCTTSLTVLAAQRQGVKSLVVDAEGGTAVERVLARGLQESSRKLADLVYELAKACLVVVQDIDRRLHLERRPREQQVIQHDVRGVTSRLPARDRQVLNGLPHVKPSEETALVAAESCIRILERVEGATERQRLSWAVWLICAGKPGEAEGELRRVLADCGMKELRLHAYRNLQWALNRQHLYDAAVDIGAAAMRAYPKDWQLTYNLAVSSACAGNRDLFKRITRHLVSLEREAPKSQSFRQTVLRFEAERFAEKLRLPIRDVQRVFGLRHESEATR